MSEENLSETGISSSSASDIIEKDDIQAESIFDDVAQEEIIWYDEDQTASKKPKKKRFIWKAIRRILLSIFTLIILLAFALYTACYVVFMGPSESARDKLVTSTLEMSAAKWVPSVFFTKDQIDEIIAKNSVLPTDEVTKPELVTPPTSDDPKNDNEWANYPDGIQLHKIKNDTYRGYVMIIRDPSKVYVATSSDFKGTSDGLRIMDVYNREGAIAAINGGGFPDAGGTGTGNVPVGLTMSEGKLLWGSASQWYNGVIGFDKNNILIVGNMTGQKAIELGMRDCVCFGPILVVNGEPVKIAGDSGSLNPRTAIGQRADGAVIFLCVDGRMPSSLGASYSDLIDIMIEFGAVNAANLDGGSSTHMIYGGEYINVSSSLYGPRRMPTFFMVKGE